VSARSREAVAVEGSRPIVDVRSAGIREVVEQERIVELPLQGRQVTDLIMLAGGAVNLGSPVNRSFQSGVQISVAGGLSSGVGYTLDGPCTTTRRPPMACRCRSPMPSRSSAS
jgi:hypothetical protein